MPRTGRILVVDHEVTTRTAVAELLRSEGYAVEMAADASKALASHATFSPHVVVADLEMPGVGGHELLKKLRAADDAVAVVVTTPAAKIAPAIDALRAGAAAYVTKPMRSDELLLNIDRAMSRIELERETRQLRARLRDRVAPDNLIGTAPAMQRALEIAEQVATTKAPVLLVGEAGTGKELVANTMHMRSSRSTGPFVKLHCSGLSESTLTTEVAAKLEQAAGGTLFVESIGDLPASLHGLLTRSPHDVRIVAATTTTLTDCQIAFVTIELPPLRARASDIPLLAKLFLDRYAANAGKKVDGFAPAAIDLMMAYDWPGNLRELEDAVSRAVAATTGSTIELRNLPPNVRPSVTAAKMPPVPGSRIDEIERFAILETLKVTNGSTSKAAEILGISVRTIQYRLHDYNLVQRDGSGSGSSGQSPRAAIGEK